MKRLILIMFVFYSLFAFADIQWEPIQVLSDDYGTSNDQDLVNFGSDYFMVWNQWGDIKIRKSSNSGSNWNPSVTIYSAMDYGGNYPVVTAYEDNVHVAYYAYTEDESEIFYSRSTNGGASFSTPEPLTISPHGAIVPQIISEGENIWIAYEAQDENYNSNIYLIKSEDNGENWSDPIDISQTNQSARWVNIAMDSNNMVIVWNQGTGSNYDDLDLFVSTSIDFGENWSAPQNISNNQAYNARVSTKVAGEDIYIAVSSKLDEIQSDIILYHSEDLGLSWDEPINVSDNSGASSRPDIYISKEDYSDKIYLTWTDDSYGQWARTYLTYSYDSGNSWEDFIPVSDDVEDASWAKIIVEPETNLDNLYLCWFRYIVGTYDSEVWGRKGVNYLTGFGTLQGYIFNSSDEPISGATISTGSYSINSDEEGFFNIDIPEGIYDVSASKEGYQINTLYNVEVIDSEVTEITFNLDEFISENYPPHNLEANRENLNDVVLTWEEPIGFNSYELKYDDGSAEIYSDIETQTGAEFAAVGFSVNEPSFIRKIKLSYQAASEQNIKIYIYGDENGQPDENDIVAGPFEVEITETTDLDTWLEINTNIPWVESGYFYIACQWENGNDFKIGTDETNPDGFSYATADSGINWTNLLEEDLMIRVGIASEERDKNILGYNVYRGGEKINDSLINALEYIDEDLEIGQSYSYFTTAIYEEGESIESNLVDLEIPTPVVFPPQGLVGFYEEEGDVLSLNWDNPETYGDTLSWHHDNGYESVGGDAIQIFEVASRYTPTDLADFAGDYLTEINFYLDKIEGCQIYAKVWTGGSQFYSGNSIFEKEVTELSAESWHKVEIGEPIKIDDSEELWIGYRVLNPQGVYPAGTDVGPAIPYKGDMILYGSDWISLYDNFGFDINWCIEGKVVSAGDEKILNTKLDYEAFNIYKDGNFIEEVAADQVSYQINNPVQENSSFYITSTYEGIESSPSNIFEMVWVDANDMQQYKTELIGNFPNPFKRNVNSRKLDTTIHFSLEDKVPVKLEIFNIKGQKVKTLVDEKLDKGIHKIGWNGKNDNEKQLGSGVYFYHLKTNQKKMIKKMILIK